MGRGFLCLCILWLLVQHQNTKAQTVSIGAITNPTTRIGREQKVAIQLAVEKFFPQTLLAGVFDLNTTDPSPVYSYVTSLVQLGANAIITGGTAPQAFISGTVADRTKVPIVSLVEFPFLSGRNLVQMSYPETAFVRCIADIIKSYNWRKVIVVYEDDIFGSVSSTAYLLSNALRSIGSEIEYRVVFPPVDSLSDPRSSVKEALDHTKSMLSTIFIILRSSEALTPILFAEAVLQGMMSKGYIWICGNDITALLDSSFTPSFISKNMQGLVGIRSYINDSTAEYSSFYSNFQNRFKTDYEKSGEKSFDPGVHAIRAYDVVSVISLVAALSDANNRTIVENLEASNFSGLSGLIRPTSSSLDDSDRYSVFQLINVVGRSYWEMGIWVDGHGFYGNENEYVHQLPSSETLKTIVVWPGYQLTTPAGLRRLKVLVPYNTIWDNFVVVENYDSKTGNYSSISGFCIEVFIATLNCLGYEILYDFVLDSRTDYDDLVNQVHLGNADMVVGDVTILAGRSENVSFTKPYMSSGLAMLVPVKTNAKGWLPTKAFSLALWTCILVLWLYYIMLVWYHELVEDAVPDFHHSWFKQLVASLWIVCNAIFLNLDKRIRSYHTKVVMILWFFVAQLVLNSFTASLSSILVTQNLRPDVDTTKIGNDGGSFVRNYLIDVLNYSPNTTIVDIYNGSEYNEAFKNGTITAAYLEVPYLRVFLSQYDNYTVYNEIQMLGGFGFVLPKGSLLADDMSEAILKLGENGTLRQIENKWFSISLSNYAPTDDDKSQSLGLSNYMHMFVISSCLALLTVLHRFINNATCRGQAVAPEQVARQETTQAPNIELVVVPHDVRVQQIQQHVSNEQAQELRLHDIVPEIEEPMVHGRPEIDDLLLHEFEDVPLHDEVHNIVQQPLGLRTDGMWRDFGGTSRRTRRSASVSSILTSTRPLQSFPSLRPLQAEEIQEQSSCDSTKHEEVATEPLHDRIVRHDIGKKVNLELQNTDPQPGSSNFSRRYQRAASSSNISRPSRVLWSFLSLRSRVPENETQPLRYSVAHETGDRSILDSANEVEEPALVLSNVNAGPGLSNTLRYRRLNNLN